MGVVHASEALSTIRRSLRPIVDNSGVSSDSDEHGRPTTEIRRVDQSVDSGPRVSDVAGGSGGLPPLTEQELWDAYRGCRGHDPWQ